MPSKSIEQQRLMQIAEHHPEEVSKKNRGVLKMSHQQLHDFASGSEKRKPEYASHPSETLDNAKHYMKTKYGKGD